MMLGVVLCGEESRRMGSDKGLLSGSGLSLQRLIAGSGYKSIPVKESQKFANYNSTNPFA